MTPQEALTAEELRRQRGGLPPMTPAERQAFTAQLAKNQADTAGREAREAGRGTVKISPKGTKVLDGPYKGLSRPQMEQAIVTGAPVPTGKSGYVLGGELSPRTGQITPRAPAPAPSAAAMPAGGRMVPGRSAGSQVYVPAGEKAWFENQPASAAAPPPAASAPAPSAGGRVMASLGMTGSQAAQQPQVPFAPRLAQPAQRPQGKIDGLPAQEWLQAAANRQGVANSYGTIKPQIAAPTPAPPAATPIPAANLPSVPRIAPPMAAARSAAPSMVSSPPSGMPQNLRVPSRNALGSESLNPYTQLDNTMKGAVAPFMKAPAPTGAAALKTNTQKLPTMAAPAPTLAAAPKPPASAPSPAATPNPAAAAGVPSITWGQVGQALNFNNPDAWINDPLGMTRRRK